MFAEADRLDGEARLLEEFAEDRYASSARLYTGGSSAFIRSLSVADDQLKEARALRTEACEYRRVAAFMAEQEQQASPGPARGDE
ncbi:hypothetical protein A5777_16485 [Gordonia sp. 852002-10350_SCH5691597]|nr:hypothetical protein A5777_16485 [Gordonia sp. 852002-10350_SCH5691597]